MATSWFSRTGSGNPSDPNSYVKQALQPSCLGNNSICAIFATVDTGNLPSLTAALKDEMLLALDSRTSTTNVKLRT